jgi:hypothetical protein
LHWYDAYLPKYSVWAEGGACDLDETARQLLFRIESPRACAFARIRVNNQ